MSENSHSMDARVSPLNVRTMLNVIPIVNVINFTLNVINYPAVHVNVIHFNAKCNKFTDRKCHTTKR